MTVLSQEEAQRLLAELPEHLVRLFALQELGGWESVEMVRRYAHLAANHLAPFAEGLRGLNVSDVRNEDAKKSHPVNRKGLHLCKPLICWLRGPAT